VRTEFPPVRSKDSFAKFGRGFLELGPHGVIPTIQLSEHRNDRDDRCQFVFGVIETRRIE
jgi:hypothetical protein